MLVKMYGNIMPKILLVQLCVEQGTQSGCVLGVAKISFRDQAVQSLRTYLIHDAITIKERKGVLEKIKLFSRSQRPSKVELNQNFKSSLLGYNDKTSVGWQKAEILFPWAELVTPCHPMATDLSKLLKFLGVLY